MARGYNARVCQKSSARAPSPCYLIAPAHSHAGQLNIMVPPSILTHSPTLFGLTRSPTHLLYVHLTPSHLLLFEIYTKDLITINKALNKRLYVFD